MYSRWIAAHSTRRLWSILRFAVAFFVPQKKKKKDDGWTRSRGFQLRCRGCLKGSSFVDLITEAGLLRTDCRKSEQASLHRPRLPDTSEVTRSGKTTCASGAFGGAPSRAEGQG